MRTYTNIVGSHRAFRILSNFSSWFRLRNSADVTLVAPFREAHGAAASLFLQTLLHKHLLMGHEFRTAFRLANDGLEGTDFRHWRGGVVQT
jgi:hypothetical protein